MTSQRSSCYIWIGEGARLRGFMPVTVGLFDGVDRMAMFWFFGWPKLGNANCTKQETFSHWPLGRILCCIFCVFSDPGMFSMSWNRSGQQMPRTYWETYIAKYPVAATPGWHHHFGASWQCIWKIATTNSLRKPIKKTSQNGGNMKKTTRSKKYQIGHFALQIPPPVNERQVGRLADPPYVATVPLATKKTTTFSTFSVGFSLYKRVRFGGKLPRT